MDNFHQSLYSETFREMFSSSDFELFETMWTRLRKDNFVPHVRLVLDKAHLLKRLSKIAELDSTENQSKIVKQIEGVRSHIIELIKSNDMASLKRLLYKVSHTHALYSMDVVIMLRY